MTYLSFSTLRFGLSRFGLSRSTRRKGNAGPRKTIDGCITGLRGGQTSSVVVVVVVAKIAELWCRRSQLTAQKKSYLLYVDRDILGGKVFVVVASIVTNGYDALGPRWCW